ncbi:MAG: universal stress protein [Candidatus Obscuribacterales bacterium]|nr:universal stress protein [Candidatus Obscuribacterales bacterium]
MRFVVAFSSPKRSARTVEAAARHAKALGAEVILVRMVPDPNKVGVVAQLISSDRPVDKAKSQIDDVVAKLKEQGIDATGEVRIGEVAMGIVKAAVELKADLLFVGTTTIGAQSPTFFLMKKDPIVHYLVDHSPISLVLIRHDVIPDSELESE